MEEADVGDIKEWYTAHFISSLESPVKADFGVIVLNQPIEMDIVIFRKIWNQGCPLHAPMLTISQDSSLRRWWSEQATRFQ